VTAVACMPHERYRSVQTKGLSMCIDLWFDKYTRVKGGSTVEACTCVLLCAFAS
jgi:hypothetical protein